MRRWEDVTFELKDQTREDHAHSDFNEIVEVLARNALCHATLRTARPALLKMCHAPALYSFSKRNSDVSFT